MSKHRRAGSGSGPAPSPRARTTERGRRRGGARRRGSAGRPPRALVLVATAGLLLFGAGWVHALYEQPGAPVTPTRTDARPKAHAGAPEHAARGGARPDALQGLPAAALSEATRARIPAEARQLVLVTGEAKDSSESTAALYTRRAPGGDWVRAAQWPARNGARGWSTGREYGDLTSPQGVFSLSDAGGLLAAPPGTKLPYDRDPGFVATGRGVNGESLAGSFDYVVAIDYNRRRGVSPLDPVMPDGEGRGGNIWLHVDHDGPSQGCIGLPRAAMKQLLETLDPAAHPVVAMGPAGF
ncbi:L,D-transpeptidase family protein [Streptomyces racemochromogenes]|uniref:L,D-transpeptidase family protein n=1 Tax=Streptomyces racemochromogenes TaxID=67353 RepID=A0ABW7PBS3_9ACTN